MFSLHLPSFHSRDNPMPVSPPANAQRVYQGLLHDVWQWEQALHDGSTARFECVTRPDTVAVIAFLDPQTILLTEQHHAGRPSFFDVAGGRVEPGEAAEACARREFLEETGYHIGRLQLFRELPLLGTIRFQKMVFLATDLTRDAAGPTLDAGERIALVPTAWDDAVTRCLRHELRGQDAMLAILAMAFDPEARKIKEQFLT